MTLTTHAIVGAAAASIFPHFPVAAFAAGFVSHLAIDAIPHWDEAPAMLRSLRKSDNELKTDMVLNRDFLFDLAYLGTESIVGIAAGVIIFAFWITSAAPYIVFIGAIGGLLPDFLHIVYFKTHLKLMEPFERFHIWIQRQYPDVRYLFTEVTLVVGVTLLLGILR